VLDNLTRSSYAAFTSYPKPYFFTLYAAIDPHATPKQIHVFITFATTTGFDRYESVDVREKASEALN